MSGRPENLTDDGSALVASLSPVSASAFRGMLAVKPEHDGAWS